MKKFNHVSTLKERGFIFCDLGAKLDFGIFHKDVEDGKKLLGWIRKSLVQREENGTSTIR
jgi:hypothetical protein